MPETPEKRPSAEVIGAATALLDSLLLAADVEDWQTADHFVALTTNDETHDIHLTGPFSDAKVAWAWATAHEAELNRGAPASEIPFVVTVFPMKDPS
jgi:hypothetical protein